MAIANELTINSATALQMAETIFGTGITVTGATYTGDAASAGIYSGAGTTIPGISPTGSGVILSTGRVADFTNSTGSTNTNEVANRSTNTAGVDGDSQLNAVAGQGTFDASILQATFVPDGDTITMQFVFSSEEYPEYVNQNVNDAFGVWVNGSFVPVSISVAGSVAVDEVNAAENENFYRSNSADQFNTEMDGLTYVLSIKAPVNPGVANTIKIAIGDGGDAVFDSNLLIAADSVQTVTLAMDDTINTTANTTRTFDILANDVSTTGAPLTITQIMGQNIVAGQTITLTSGQQVRLNADGTITVTSNGTLGQEAFSYTVSNGTTTDVGYVKLNTGAAKALDGIVSGTSGDDLINASYVGDPDGDRIDNNDATGVQGTTGNADLIYAGAGNDTMLAGAGNDIIFAGSGNDQVFGGAGDDRATLGSGNDSFGSAADAGDGNDSVTGGAGNDSLWGGAGNDTFDGGSEADSLDGGADSDQLTGGTGADTVAGGTGSDTVTGGAGDVITGGEDAGGGDNDVLRLSGVGSITFGGGNDEAGTVTFTDGSTLSFAEIETIRVAGAVDGTSSGDTIGAGYVDAEGDQRDGTDGNADTIFGYAGHDSIDAGAGNDTVFGGSGNDTLAGGIGNDSLMGEAGADEFRVAVDAGTDTIIGGEAGTDQDRLVLEAGTSGPGYSVTLTGAEAGTYTTAGGASGSFTEIEGLTLSARDDTLNGAAATGPITASAGAGSDALTGGIGADSLAGDAGADALTGSAGNDTLQGGADADTIFGGAGDVVDGGETTTAGGVDNDLLVVEAGSTITYGGGNNESGTVTLASGGTLVFSGIENVVLAGPVDGTAGADSMGPGYTDLNGDQIDGADGVNDTIFGYGGNDSIAAGAGNDRVDGGTGDDTLAGGAGADTLQGGGGLDMADYSASGAGVAVNLSSGAASGGDATGDSIAGGIDGVIGSAFNDTLTGFDAEGTTPGNLFTNVLYGAGGNDLIDGLAGNDSLFGGTGADTLIGGAGDDTLSGGNDADLINADAGDVVDGGSGGTDNDTLVATGVVSIVFAGGNSEAGVLTFADGRTLTFAEIEHLQLNGTRDGYVHGTAGDDVMGPGYVDATGDIIDANDAILPGHAANEDWIYAGAGNDTVLAGADGDRVYGGEDQDFVYGGDGNDTVYGGAGADRLDGAEGRDLLHGDGGDDWIFGDIGQDTAYGGTGNDSLFGGGGEDVLYGGEDDDLIDGGNDSDTISGGTGADTILGGEAADAIAGNEGQDSLDGGGGNDTIDGGAGGDTIYGGNDADAVEGGGGADLIYGGADADTVVGGDGNDTIIGGAGNDRIDGGAGDDQIDGSGAGGGRDTLAGGAGNDTITAGGATLGQVDGGDDRDTVIVTSAASMQLDGGAGGDDFDTLDLTAFGKDRTEVVYTSPDKEDGYVRLFDAAGAETGRIDFTDIEKVIPCFTPGTLIQTDRGLVPVEDLRPGARVLTRDDGFQPLRWIGRRDLGPTELAARPAFAPVLVRAGAMGPGMPRRDMMVSPQHRLLVTGRRAELLFGEAEVLVAALHLLGRPGITRARVPGVSYLHLLFDTHQIIQSDGLWTESFQPGAAVLGGLADAARDEVLALFPELGQGELYPAARLTLKPHEVRVLMAA